MLNIIIPSIHSGFEEGEDSLKRLRERSERLSYEKIAELLIKSGVNLSHVDDEGSSALHWAARYGNERMVDLLVKSNADVNIVDGKRRTALNWVADSGKIQHLPMIHFK